jgi:transposase
MKKHLNQKQKTLKKLGVLNPRPDEVSDELFLSNDFFDPEDIVQVKYEMLRCVKTGEKTATKAAESFGFSRPSFYYIKTAFNEKGFYGFIPEKRGPRSGHKLTNEIIAYILEEQQCTPSISPTKIVEMIQKRFGFTVHRRTVERTLKNKKKLIRKKKKT